MLWLSPPSYLRWLGATALVLVVLWGQFSPAETQPHPFATQAVYPGQTLTAEHVEFRSVPAGILPAVSLPATISSSIESGEPILPSHLGEGPDLPPEWWAMEVVVPEAARPGSRVQLVATNLEEESVIIPGVVITLDTGSDPFGDSNKALVAIPPQQVAVASEAAAGSRLNVLVAADEIEP